MPAELWEEGCWTSRAEPDAESLLLAVDENDKGGTVDDANPDTAVEDEGAEAVVVLASVKLPRRLPPATGVGAVPNEDSIAAAPVPVVGPLALPRLLPG